MFLFLACIGKKNVTHTQKTLDSTGEIEYIHAFTEATKHALFGNYSSAIKIYKNLLKVRPESSAVFYQLSSVYMRIGEMQSAKEYGKKAFDLDESNIWYALHMANLYQYENNLDSAIICYERIVKIKNDLEYKYNLALLYSKNEKNEKALKIINELENEIKKSNEISYLKHTLYHNLEYTDSAIFELEEMIRREPEKTENYGLLAEYLNEVNMKKESREVYLDIMEKDSLNGLLLLSYAEFLKVNEEYEEAQKYYIKAINVETIDYETKLGAILLYLNDKDEFDRFGKYLEEVVIEFKKKYDIFRSYAVSADYYLKMKNLDGASDDLRRCIELEEENIIIWEQYLYILSYNEKSNELVHEAKKAINIFPEESSIAFYYAYGLNKLRNFNQSIKTLREKEEFVKDREMRIQYYNLLAENYREIEKNDSSDLYYEKILEIDRENLMIRNNYAYYLSLRSENLERAEELSKYTIEYDPNNATFLDTYGWILFKMEETKKAYNYIKKAIEYGAGNNSEVLDHYGDILFKMGNCREAIKMWKLAIEYNERYKEECEKKINGAKNCE